MGLGRFHTVTDLLLQSGPYEPNVILGAVQAIPTGNLDLDDPQYVEFTYDGLTVIARPCYGFGARAYVPTPEWLQKYKNQVFFWLIFEEGYENKGIYLGWCFLEGQEQDVQDFPNRAMWRSVNFLEEYDDTTEAWRVTHRPSGKLWEFTKSRAYLTTPSFQVTSDADVTLTSKTTVVSSSASIKLGSKSASSPAVLGDQLNDNLTQLLNNLGTLCTNLASVLAAQGVAASSNTATAGLAPGFAQTSEVFTQSASLFTGIITKLAAQNSKKIILE